MKPLCLLVVLILAAPATAQIAVRPLPSEPKYFTVSEGVTGMKSPTSVGRDWIVFGEQPGDAHIYTISKGTMSTIPRLPEGSLPAPSVQGSMLTYGLKKRGQVHDYSIVETDLTKPAAVPRRLCDMPDGTYPGSIVHIGDTVTFIANSGQNGSALLVHDVKKNSNTQLNKGFRPVSFSISSDANAIAWTEERRIFQAVRDRGRWNVTELANLSMGSWAGNSHAQVNTTTIAFLTREYRVMHQPLEGGTPQAYPLPRSPMDKVTDFVLTDHFAVFAVTPENEESNLFLYDIQRSTMYQLTNTDGTKRNPQLWMENNQVHVTWEISQAGTLWSNIYGMTFTIPPQVQAGNVAAPAGAP